ncbi:hypothetical protein AB0K89_30855 [Streptomyces cinnamoneus]|uniref:hypothetical protein n=1 Tax=Streptomyces cinnamoneus TaxID=53446 RepID=UPI003420D579
MPAARRRATGRAAWCRTGVLPWISPTALSLTVLVTVLLLPRASADGPAVAAGCS